MCVCSFRSVPQQFIHSNLNAMSAPIQTLNVNGGLKLVINLQRCSNIFSLFFSSNTHTHTFSGYVIHLMAYQIKWYVFFLLLLQAISSLRVYVFLYGHVLISLIHLNRTVHSSIKLHVLIYLPPHNP